MRLIKLDLSNITTMAMTDIYVLLSCVGLTFMGGLQTH
jgi:hypothetical protein